jgi:hypothetical protein
MKATLYSLLMLSLLPIAVSGVAVIQISGGSLEVEPNHFGNPNEIILGTEVRGTKGANTSDWFTFTVSSSTVASLSYRGAMAGEIGTNTIHLRDSEGNELWEGIMVGDARTAQIGLPSPGTYKVLVKSLGGYGDYVGDYQFKVSVTAADQPVSAAEVAVLKSQLNTANAGKALLQAQLTAANSKIKDLEAEIANLREGQSNSNEGGGVNLKQTFDGWNWLAWPWVYSDADKDWLYYYSGSSGWAAWRNKDNKWYSFNAATKTWSTQ